MFLLMLAFVGFSLNTNLGLPHLKQLFKRIFPIQSQIGCTNLLFILMISYSKRTLILLPIFIGLLVISTQLLPNDIITIPTGTFMETENTNDEGSPASDTLSTVKVTKTTGHQITQVSSRIPPFFNIVFQPSSVNKIFSSYIEKVYARFREEIQNSKTEETISSDVRDQSIIRTYIENTGKIAVEDGSAVPKKSPQLLYSPMLPPYRYFSQFMDRRKLETSGVQTNDMCSSLSQRDYDEFKQVVSRVDLYHYPLYNMPWFYHDPNPLCGRYFLRFLENWPVPEGHQGPSVPSEFAYGKHGETDRTPLPVAGSLKHYPPKLTTSGDDGLSFQQRYLHRLATFNNNQNLIVNDDGLISLPTTTGARFSNTLGIQSCSPSGSSSDDIFINARIIGEDRIINVDVVPQTNRAKATGRLKGETSPNIIRDLRFIVPDRPGKYILEVKYVHINGSSNNPKVPKSLGVIGIRANDKGKSFKYNCFCDLQRHVYGSPVEIVVGEKDSAKDHEAQVDAKTNKIAIAPLCTEANHTSGMWVRFGKNSCQGDSNPFCKGDPGWLSDAAGFNTQMLWVPFSHQESESQSQSQLTEPSEQDDEKRIVSRRHPPHFDYKRTESVDIPQIPCRYLFHSPPGGPPTTCLRIRDKGDQATRHGGALVLVGDSVMREYSKNCALFNFRGARLVCVFNNIVLEGQHYSQSYAKAVAENILQSAIRNKAAIFGTNLGIHHMIGPCTTEQWIEFVDKFVELWMAAVRNDDKEKQFRVATRDELTEGKALMKEADNLSKDYFIMEKAIWIGPPAIHYARKGMGFQRAALWDQLAWERLEPLGFRRLNAIAPTVSRQESTWDGLHYAAERGKVQTPLRDSTAQVRQWNGGVSAMLFAMLLNMICN